MRGAELGAPKKAKAPRSWGRREKLGEQAACWGGHEAVNEPLSTTSLICCSQILLRGSFLYLILQPPCGRCGSVGAPRASLGAFQIQSYAP